VTEPIIQINGLRKVYKIGNEKVVALNRIDLTVEKGEICCLLGTSGSGKSTLLNLIAGLEKPTRGSIIIDGHNIHQMSEKQLAVFRQGNVGFVFQSYNLLSTMTALENVLRSARLERFARSG
jgi:putative ABC transport system ATP-binding protein